MVSTPIEWNNDSIGGNNMAFGLVGGVNFPNVRGISFRLQTQCDQFLLGNRKPLRQLSRLEMNSKIEKNLILFLNLNQKKNESKIDLGMNYFFL